MLSILYQRYSPCNVFQNSDQSKRYYKYEDKARDLEDERLVKLAMGV